MHDCYTRVFCPSYRIKEFALANGLMELKGSSRQKVVNPLVNALAELPIQRVRRALHLERVIPLSCAKIA